MSIIEKLIVILDNAKVIGEYKNSDEVKNEILTRIYNLDNTIGYDKLKSHMDKLKIIEYEPKKPDYKAGYAVYQTNNIYINKDASKLSQMEILVHESIHSLQKSLFFQGKNISGFIEGATQSYTNKAFNKHYSSSIGKMKINIPRGVYFLERAIFNSMAIALGDNYAKNFALKGDNTALKTFQELYGKDLYEKMRIFSNKKSKNFDQYETLQNEFLNRVYNRKIHNVKSIDDAKEYFTELRELQNNRIFSGKDTYFENFYKKRYNFITNDLKTKGYDISSLDEFAYREIQLYPVNSQNNKKNMLKSFLLNNAESNSLEQFKRYRYTKDDKILDIITKDGIPFSYGYCDDYSNFKQASFIRKKDDNKQFDTFSSLKVSVHFDDKGKLIMSQAKDINSSLDENLILEETDLMVTPEEWEKKKIELEETKKALENEGILNKIKNSYTHLISILKNKNQKKLPDVAESTPNSYINNSPQSTFSEELRKGVPPLEEQLRVAQNLQKNKKDDIEKYDNAQGR